MAQSVLRGPEEDHIQHAGANMYQVQMPVENSRCVGADRVETGGDAFGFRT